MNIIKWHIFYTCTRIAQHATTLPRSPTREDYDHGGFGGGLEVGKYATLPKATDRSKKPFVPSESVIEQSSEEGITANNSSTSTAAKDHTNTNGPVTRGSMSPSLPLNQTMLKKWSQSLDNIKDAVVNFTN